jgi:cytochrome c oxidase subunit 4
MRPRTAPVRLYVAVFALLLALLALSIEAARHDLGRGSFPIAAAVASVKSLLIAVYFMELRESRTLTRLVAAASLLWLALLFTLSLADYWTRVWDM